MSFTSGPLCKIMAWFPYPQIRISLVLLFSRNFCEEHQGIIRCRGERPTSSLHLFCHMPHLGDTQSRLNLFRPFSGMAHPARCPLPSCFPAGQSCAKVHAAEAWTCCCPLTTVEDTSSQPSVHEFLFLVLGFFFACFVCLSANLLVLWLSLGSTALYSDARPQPLQHCLL